jgi:hypothetical protein
MIKDPEDEAFEEIERQATRNIAAVNATFDDQYRIWKRNETIEEVAKHVERLKAFGQDTVDSLAIYIREMKK